MPMEIPKPTPAARRLFDSLVPAGDTRVEVKPMFGNVAAFVNGNMFMGVFGPDIGVKLNEPDQQALRAAGGGAFGPKERPMGGYVALPASFTAAEAQPWVSRALQHVGSLPAKSAKAASRKR
jgi:TfoX/Sxy family transcriptional regulator of competence genes